MEDISDLLGGRSLGLFVAPSLVPDAWLPRAVQVAFVPLLADEAARILQAGTEHVVVELEDLALVDLTARGLSPHKIARHLGVPVRTVYRHQARLRDLVGAPTTAELCAQLAGSGFGSGIKVPRNSRGGGFA